VKLIVEFADAVSVFFSSLIRDPVLWGSRFEAQLDQVGRTLTLTGIASLARSLFQSYVMLAF
jgi:hypothetical protein